MSTTLSFKEITTVPTPLQPRAAAKVEAFNAKIPAKWRLKTVPSAQEQLNVTGAYIEQYLERDEVLITNTVAESLVKRMVAGELSVVKVVEAFCHRAAVAHQLVNCLIEIMFDEALANAAELDKSYSSGTKPSGLLYGLPISLKDQFYVRNVDTSMGYVAWIGTPDWSNPLTTESEMVREVRFQGAIPFCKTNIPTTLMHVETINNIMGYSFNPYNRLLSTGGSSGGEGALLALRGSPLGIGSDIGGSVRIPSSFNNLYGLRPSHGRFSYMNTANSNPGQPHVNSVFGPMSPALSSVKLFTKSILASMPWERDPNVVELPWREEHYNAIKSVKPGELCVAILSHDGIAHPHPPISRALSLTKSALEKAGIKTINWSPPSHAAGQAILYRIFAQDGGTEVHSILAEGNEPLLPHLKNFFGEEARPPINATQVAELTLLQKKYKEEYVAYWNSTALFTGTGRPVDAVILPVAPHAAAIPSKYIHVGYSAIVNLLDNSSLAVPVTFADKNVDLVDESFIALSEFDKTVQEGYDPAAYHGAPAGVQIMGRRLNEERVIALGEVLKEALRNP